eukprot:SM000024S07849  [mRNA]  locus=s24:875423:876485:- [translate_table: standard]
MALRSAFKEDGNVLCSGKPSVVREGRRSFPSGHSSWAFAGLGFLSLYLASKLYLNSRKGFVYKSVLVLLPLLGALAVGISRIDDYWHHWTDVLAGSLLGLAMAGTFYFQLLLNTEELKQTVRTARMLWDEHPSDTMPLARRHDLEEGNMHS